MAGRLLPRGGVAGEGLSPHLEPTECPAQPPGVGWSLSEEDFRELDYTHAGGYDQSWVGMGGVAWPATVRASQGVSTPGEARGWLDRTSLVHVGPAALRAALPAMAEALRVEGCSTRVTVVVGASEAEGELAPELEGAGFRPLFRLRACERRVLGPEGEPSRLARDAVVLCAGVRRCGVEGAWLDHAAVRQHMDPRDRGEPAGPPGRKAAIAWTPIVPQPERWVGKGLPEAVETIMTTGVVIDADPSLEVPPEIPQYPFADAEHFVRGAAECDRALVVGHLEPVPPALVAWAEAHGTVHPWTVVHQSEEKWRSCHDYSDGTNRKVVTAPFTLPTVWDAMRVLRPNSHFAKYDLRDGFWSVGVNRGSRHHLMVRHPADGRLLWCTSLPFGYALSPQHFCAVTEAVAGLFRKRVVGLGVHCFVFVDDYLVVGDTHEATLVGMRVMEELMAELALPWAPHKQRGPTRVIEFLGHLLVNLPHRQCVALTENRQARMVAMVDSWLSRMPLGSQPAHAEPRELAGLLGHLVFCSEVVPSGRTFMQSMLRSFKGLEVDWMRGSVRYVRSAWQRLELSGGFWRDLAWWRSALLRANSTSVAPAWCPEAGPAHPPGELALVGSDASDLACGGLVWLDGAREEVTLTFTAAERRRPINFRELRGCLRVLEVYGERLRHRTVVMELDNTCAVQAARKLHCKVEDMQELLRRIVELAQRHGFRLRSSHTPGAFLNRPDATSRGAAPEEPRVRMRAGAFDALSRRFGPFTEYLGAEREHGRRAMVAPGAGGRPTLWLHPTFDTVGTALSVVGERLSPELARCAKGLIIVPYAPEAAWWRLTRHFVTVARYPAGSPHLEECRMGKWCPVTSQRESVALAFPRLAGARTLRLLDAMALGCPEARALVSAHPAAERAAAEWLNPESPLPAGSLLYSPPRGRAREGPEGGAVAGCVYLTLEPFDGSGELRCVHLHDGGTAQAARRLARGGLQALMVDGRSCPPRGAPWAPALESLWLVNHLGSPAAGTAGQQPARSPTWRRWLFDFGRADAEVRAVRTAMGLFDPLAASGALSAAAEELRAAAPSDDDDAMRPMSRYLERRLEAHRDADGQLPCARVGEAEAEPRAGQAPAERMPPTTPVGRAGGAGSRRLRTPEPARAGLALAQNRYAGRRCSGCGLRVAEGGWLLSVAGGQVHNSARCVALAEEALRSAVEEPTPAPEAVELTCLPAEDGTPAGPHPSPAGGGKRATSGSDQRRAQLAGQVSQARRLRVRACLEGRCGIEGQARMTCLGKCGATVHGVACCQLSRGFASLGCFTCPECRLRHLMPGLGDRPAPEAALAAAECTMLIEMSTGAEATGAALADVIGLESRFALSMAEATGEAVVLPRDDPEACKCFLAWIVLDRERALSLDSLWRALGSVCGRTRAVNVTHDVGLKAFYRHLRELHGEESHPRTATTRRMVVALFTSVLAEQIARPELLARARLMLALELMCGLRVGEVLGGGDHHGLLANHTYLLTNLETGEVSVEVKLEHSKTKHLRWVNALGTSLGEGKVPLAACLREWWAASGYQVHSEKSGGFLVESPDYSVLRVSMLGMTQVQLDLLIRRIHRSADCDVRAHAPAAEVKARQRFTAGGSMHKRYINVAGGREGCAAIRTAALELARAGLGEFLSVGAGPLIRATFGPSLTHMPLNPQSSYAALHAAMDEAFRLANGVALVNWRPNGVGVAAEHWGDRDPELDLQGLAAPLWGHHSNRRCADTVARQTMARSGATEQDIDLVFGWQEKLYSAKMQVHYESKFVRDVRKRVTMYL